MSHQENQKHRVRVTQVMRNLTAIVLVVLVVSSCASGSDQADDIPPSQDPTTTATTATTVPPTVQPTVTPVQIPTFAPVQTATPVPTATSNPSPTTAPTATVAPVPTTGPNPTVTPAAPTATAVPPTATAVPPTATPTPGGALWVGCVIEPKRVVTVGEILTYTALQNPTSAQVSFVFDHGDNTLDPGRVSKAFYREAGTYTVRLRWSHGNQNGTVYCGQVTVVAGTATPTPTATAVPPVSISCTIAPQRTMFVGEVLTYTVGQTPGNIAINYVFDHGDGTLDPGPISYAFYRDPGTYTVTLKWSYQGRSGTIPCGVVTVVPVPGTPTPTPTSTPAPPVTIGCLIEPKRTVVVNEILTFTALQTPADVPVLFVFDHGDGTRDVTGVSKAFYREPGSYSVTLDWAYGDKSGTVLCGVVTVTSS